MNSKDILDSEFTEKITDEHRVFSFIRIINIIEIVLFILIALERIWLIFMLESIAPRGLINIISYESGWSFVVLIGLIISNISQFRNKLNPYHWLAKYSGYFCLLFILGFYEEHYGIVILLILFYYSLNRVSNKFDVTGTKKLFYIIISIAVALTFFFLDVQYPLLTY